MSAKHILVNADGKSIHKKLIDWFGHSDKYPSKSKVSSLSFNFVQRRLNVCCRCIVAYRLPRDALPKSVQEFIALHDSKMVRFAFPCVR